MQVGLVWQVKPDRHADPRRKRPLTWRVLADEVGSNGREVLPVRNVAMPCS